MTDSERALDVLRELRDELAHNAAICFILENAIDVVRDVAPGHIWELADDVAAAAADPEPPPGGGADDSPPVKLPSRAALRAVPNRDTAA